MQKFKHGGSRVDAGRKKKANKANNFLECFLLALLGLFKLKMDNFLDMKKDTSDTKK